MITKDDEIEFLNAQLDYMAKELRKENTIAMKKVWVFEMCYCKYETGYAAQSMHSTKEEATQAMDKRKKRDSDFLCDGYKVVEWEIDEKPTP